jgi:hypothetical protein
MPWFLSRVSLKNIPDKGVRAEYRKNLEIE